MFTFLGNKYVVAMFGMLLIALVSTQPALAQQVPSTGGGPVDWGPLLAPFTGAEGWVMQVAAILCVFTFVGGLITTGVQGGVHSTAIVLFGLCFLCVCVLASPAFVSWIQTHVAGLNPTPQPT